MKFVRIGDVCKLMTGGTPSRTRPEYFENGTIKWLVSGDINQVEIFDCDGRITVEAMKSSNTKILPMNSVMIALNGQGKTRGTVALLRTEATCNQSLVSISPINEKELLSEFLFHNLRMRYQELRRMTGDDGNDRRGLNMSLIRDIEIPLPSLEKQRDIVEKLDSAFVEIDLLEGNLDLLTFATENLQASLLASFFDLNEDEVTEDYSFHSLGSVSLVKGGKRLPKGTKWSPTPTKYPYIRVTDMKLGKINEDNLVFVPNEIRPLIKNYTVNAGNIIISIAGTIGEIAVVPESLDKASLTENAAKIILQKEILNPEYCAYFLKSPVCRREIDLLVRTTTQPKLALFRIESLRIPIPPIEKQHEIVIKLDSAFAEIELLKAQIKIEKDYATALRQSLLSSAFTQEEAVA